MGAVFGLFAAFYYWSPKFIGKSYNELLGKIHFWTMFLGVESKIHHLFETINEILHEIECDKFNANSILEEKIDFESNDVKNNELELILNNLPNPKLPEPKNKNKNILKKLDEIPAEEKFLNIKDCYTKIVLNIKNKAGVYMFFNLINGNSYIGSSVKLDRRFRIHMSSISSLKLPLYKAINKYGLNNFAFIILQYCESDVNICVALEQTYLDLYNSKYNILNLAGSSQGFKHSPESILN
jgi:hypothetical protein